MCAIPIGLVQIAIATPDDADTLRKLHLPPYRKIYDHY